MIRQLGLPMCLLGMAAMAFGCAIGPGAPADISGDIKCAGTKTGAISLTFKGPVAPQTLAYLVDDRWKGSTPYHLIVLEGTYSLTAYLDTNGDNRQQSDEPSGYYDSNNDGKPDKLFAHGKVTADITLTDR